MTRAQRHTPTNPSPCPSVTPAKPWKTHALSSNTAIPSLMVQKNTHTGHPLAPHHPRLYACVSLCLCCASFTSRWCSLASLTPPDAHWDHGEDNADG
ncbi:hypothetical protein E2C01_096616 [Portunus trituberculatus]|uniref:Uncharacterized protein n=1 Tax=Portunus trituberculatus TaxID=210409 RepID=A0A5B7K3A2_PORTR|nr:hypothetical protein [Portunus trituberculatus]